MNSNGYMGQLKGPFKANEELYTRIKESCIEKMDSIRHLGVQTITGDRVVIEINGEEFEEATVIDQLPKKGIQLNTGTKVIIYTQW